MIADRYARLFVLFGVGALWCGAFFGVVGSWQHVVPDIFDAVPFVKARPLHVSLVVAWIFMVAVGGVYHYLPQLVNVPLHAPHLVRLHLWLWVGTGLAILGSYAMGRFGGREYWEFPPWLGVLVVGSWLLLVYNFFRTALKQKGPWPVYLWMWATGIVFFLFTFLEAYTWLWQRPDDNVVRDLTVQWKAYGALTGSWNMLVYGTSMVVMERISGDRGVARSNMAFLLYALGFTNLLFGWAHHVYPVPSAPWLRILAYGISMTEWIILARIIRQWRVTMQQAIGHREQLVHRFLYASELWVFLNLGLALLISIPAINLFTHGTHITVAHAMGSTIGINTMILFASVFHLASAGQDVPVSNTAGLRWGFRLFNGGLMLFWLSLIGAGMVKGWYTVMTDLPFQRIMEHVVPFLASFAVWGLVLFTGITLLGWQAMRSLWWSAPRNTATARTSTVVTPPPTLRS
jgi:nitric oxide reductase subunit B